MGSTEELEPIGQADGTDAALGGRLGIKSRWLLSHINFTICLLFGIRRLWYIIYLEGGRKNGKCF